MTPASQSMISVILGAEDDRELFGRLAAEVRALGGSFAEKEWCLGGSEEYLSFEIILADCSLEVVSESFVGLSLRGSESHVMPLARRIVPDQPLLATAYDEFQSDRRLP